MTSNYLNVELGMLIIRRIVCVVSWGFIYPRAFVEDAEEKPTNQL